jgi:hypothetical protein
MATKKMGRPLGSSDYPNKEKIKDKIVFWISEGKTLRDFCRLEEMPSFRTIYDWEHEDEDFAARIVRARDIGSDSIAEECLEIIDKVPLEVFDEAGNKRYDPGSITWNKNRAEHRLKLLSKWNPRKYGDKVTVAGDDANPLVVETSFDIFGELLKNMTLKRQTGE